MNFQSAADAVAASIRCMFDRWAALVLTVEHQGVPKQLVDELLDETITTATDPKRFDEEEYLSIFYTAFDRMDASIEDGSPELVAKQILRVRDAAEKGNFAPAQEIVQKALRTNPSLSKCISGGMREPTEEVVNSEEPQSSGPIVDDDGFTHVVRKGRRNRQQSEQYRA